MLDANSGVVNYLLDDRFWTGEVVEVLEPSEDRVTPAWPLAGPLAMGGGVGGVAPATEAAILTLVPYYSWANREVGQMRVWLRR